MISLYSKKQSFLVQVQPLIPMAIRLHGKISQVSLSLRLCEVSEGKGLSGS